MASSELHNNYYSSYSSSTATCTDRKYMYRLKIQHTTKKENHLPHNTQAIHPSVDYMLHTRMASPPSLDRNLTGNPGSTGAPCLPACALSAPQNVNLPKHRTGHDLHTDHLDPVLVTMECCAGAVSYRSHLAHTCARAVAYRSHLAHTCARAVPYRSHLAHNKPCHTDHTGQA